MRRNNFSLGGTRNVLYGTFHSVSKKHLDKYLGEFEFHYNHLKMDDGAYRCRNSSVRYTAPYLPRTP